MTKSIWRVGREKEYYPNNNEIVYGFDEKFEIWCLVVFNSDTNRFSDQNGKRVYPLDVMHEWKREYNN